MSQHTVFIDGEHGTTGLQIRDRLARRTDIRLLSLAEEERKDAAARKRALHEADIAILCLPDDAAREAAKLAEGSRCRLIDASTAHRTAPDWVYGFPEMTREQAGLIAGAARVSNPGCYPTAFVSLVRPFVVSGLVPSDWPVTVNAVSGYSGGGKTMIAAYERDPGPDASGAPFRLYGLTLSHKHVGEMQMHALLVRRPLFVPSVGNFAQGMLLSVPLQLWALPGRPTPDALHAVLSEQYDAGGMVEVVPREECLRIADLPSVDPSQPNPETLAGSDRMRLFVFGNDNDEQAVLVAQLDNLGKGAAGQAIQCLNLMIGMPTI